jgi:hypothetical protein
VSDINRVDIDEQLRQDSAICKRGIETDFWRLVKKILGDLSEQAKNELVYCDPHELPQIAQRQAVCRVVQQLITTVEGTAELT